MPLQNKLDSEVRKQCLSTVLNEANVQRTRGTFLQKLIGNSPFFGRTLKNFIQSEKKIHKHCERCKLVETGNQILLTFKFGVDTKSNRICGETSLT